MIDSINKNTQFSNFYQQIGSSQNVVSQSSLSASQNLTSKEKQQVTELKRQDTEVKAHEHAHKQAGGRYVQGIIHYDYEKGPDGKQYAVGGEVSIDTSPVHGDPEATIDKMTTVRKAALAPKNPSSQDRRVASDASRKKMEAQKELDSLEKESYLSTTTGISQYQAAASLTPNTSLQGTQLNLIG